MMRTGLGVLTAGALALPIFASGDALAATQRWAEPGVSSTLNDGLEVTELTLNGRTVVYSASTPFFLFNGQRYELTDDARVAGPFAAEADGFVQVFADYVVPVNGGLVNARVAYTLIDQDGLDEAQVSAWVDFQGPKGDYRFFWRIDSDVAARQNVLQATASDGWLSLDREGVYDMDLDPMRVTDASQTNVLTFAPHLADAAQLYAVRFHENEAESHPALLADDERLEGDLVLWVETRLDGVSSGLTGPDMKANVTARASAILEQDKMTSAIFVPPSVTVYGETRSVASGFGTAGISIPDSNVKQDKTNIADDSSSTNAELHSLLVSNKTYEYMDSSSTWYSWVGVVLKSSSGVGVLGIMFDDGSTNTDGKPRQGCAVFYDAHNASWPEGDSVEAELLLSMTHEAGHCYNQHHEDFCPGRTRGATFSSNSAIMGYAFMDTSHWTFSTGSIATMTSEDEQWSRPGHGVDFTTNGSYNMTSEHEAKHVSTSCKRFCCYSQ